MEKLIEHFMESNEEHEAISECKDKCLNHGIPSCHCKPMIKVREKLFRYESTGLEPEEIPHWIPCSERLPKIPKENIYGDTGETDCLVVADANGPTSLFMEYEQTTVRGKTVRRWKWRDRISPWKVLYWQSLPQPPKGEKP